MNYGRKHLEFCIKMYKLQWREGRYCLQGHLEIASSWQEECVKRMLQRQGVVRVTGDQCRYGFISNDGHREGPARKRTSFMTNSPCIAKKLSLRCPNTREYKAHDHVVFIKGRAKAAQVYPPALCRAVCVGLTEQLEADRKGQFLIASVNANGDNDTKQMAMEMKSIKERYKTVEEDKEDELEMAWDDVSGAELDPKVVKQARSEEIEYVRKWSFYTKVLIKERYDKTGKAPITVRWIDINKGDQTNANYRSRFVAREINTQT